LHCASLCTCSLGETTEYYLIFKERIAIQVCGKHSIIPL
jgi:hypothetical protein